MKRIVSVLLALSLLWAFLGAAAGEPAAEVYFSKTWIGCAAYGYNRNVPVLVATNDPARGRMTAEDVAGEILYFPFDGAAGLYAAGEGEPAGERAEILYLSEDRTVWTVKLNEPGKYTLGGAPYYLFDRKDPVQRGLRAELDGAVVKSAAETEKKMAGALHDWVCARVSPDFPEEDAERLNAYCGDPMNAVLTGYACRDAYALLYGMLLGAVNVRCLSVTGTAGGEEAAWNLCRLDGEWKWTDAAMDDVKDRKNAKYLSQDDGAFGKDHGLCPEDGAFTETMIRSGAYDAMLAGAVTNEQLRNADWNGLDFTIYDMEGPSWVIGESAEVTFRTMTNQLSKKKPEELLPEVRYLEWKADEHYHYDVYMDRSLEAYIQPGTLEVVRLADAAEDMSEFTLAFDKPGCYLITDGFFPIYFYLISPEAEELVSLAAELDGVAEKAKAARTEKEGAMQLFRWIRGKVRYNYEAWNWTKDREYTGASDRDLQTAWEPFGALLYGKTVCGGYSMIFHILAREAGLTDLCVSGHTLPDYDEHAWNVSCLDGKWTGTDVTWGRFAMTREQMEKDREPLQFRVIESVVFDNAFDLFATEVEQDRRALAKVPAALKYLPSDAGEYGFPEKTPAFTLPEVTVADRTISVKAQKEAAVRIVRLKEDGTENTGKQWQAESAKEFTKKNVNLEGTWRIEVHTDPGYRYAKQDSQGFILDYTDGELIRVRYRQIRAAKNRNEYPGYYTVYRYYEYDEAGNPTAAGWRLTYTGAALNMRVEFDGQGKANRYAVDLNSYIEEIKTDWEGTPEREITRLKGEEVTDPDATDPKLWEPVWFE